MHQMKFLVLVDKAQSLIEVPPRNDLDLTGPTRCFRQNLLWSYKILMANYYDIIFTFCLLYEKQLFSVMIIYIGQFTLFIHVQQVSSIFK